MDFFIQPCFRRQLREEGCLSLLLAQLRSPPLTIVSNSCGTLWNFSARNSDDQELLWELGAVPMLQVGLPDYKNLNRFFFIFYFFLYFYVVCFFNDITHKLKGESLIVNIFLFRINYKVVFVLRIIGSSIFLVYFLPGNSGIRR